MSNIDRPVDLHFNDSPLPVEGARNDPDPKLTPEQEEEYDRLDDQGRLNRHQILAEIGALPLKDEVTVVIETDETFRPNQDAVRVPQNMGRKKDRTVDRSNLSHSGRRIADKAPPTYFPYTK